MMKGFWARLTRKGNANFTDSKAARDLVPTFNKVAKLLASENRRFRTGRPLEKGVHVYRCQHSETEDLTDKDILVAVLEIGEDPREVATQLVRIAEFYRNGLRENAKTTT